jgi:hypothetical protein
MFSAHKFRVHASLLVSQITLVRKTGSSSWEVTHGERRKQDKDDGVQNQATELGGTLAGCDPAAEYLTGRLVCCWAGDEGIQNCWDNVKFSSVGHFIYMYILVTCTTSLAFSETSQEGSSHMSLIGVIVCVRSSLVMLDGPVGVHLFHDGMQNTETRTVHVPSDMLSHLGVVRVRRTDTERRVQP